MPVCLFLSVVSFSYHSLLLNWFYQVYCYLCIYLSHVGNMVHEGGFRFPDSFFLNPLLRFELSVDKENLVPIEDVLPEIITRAKNGLHVNLSPRKI